MFLYPCIKSDRILLIGFKNLAVYFRLSISNLSGLSSGHRTWEVCSGITCSWLCRLFAREDSKHVVQIVGLRELQVDSVELLLEVTLPSLLHHCSSLSTGKNSFCYLASIMNSDLVRKMSLLSLSWLSHCQGSGRQGMWEN